MELVDVDMKVMVVKEVVSGHGSGGGFYGGGKGGKGRGTRGRDRSTLILFGGRRESGGGEAYGGVEFIVVDGCEGGGGEEGGYGYAKERYGSGGEWDDDG